MASAGVPGLAAARLLPGGEVRLVGLGELRSGRTEPVTPLTLFQAPILSDPLLACATLSLADRGSLALDKPIGDATPLAVLSRYRAPLEPRRFILQPCTGTDALGMLVAEVTGTPLRKALGLEVLRPLGMDATGVDELHPEGGLAIGHDLIGDPVEDPAPAPGLTTTVSDLSHLLRELVEPRRLGQELVTRMLTPRTPLTDRLAWGLGLGLEQDGDDRWGFWLAGQGGGFSCLMAGSPARGRGAVVLTNSDTGLAVAAEVLTELMGGDHPFLDWLPAERWDETPFLIRRRLVRVAVREGAKGVGHVLTDLELSYGSLELSEALLNRVGYDLLSRGLAAEAVVVLRRNAELYPASWNVHDSLGEALAAAGEWAGAAASYRRSLELNPDNDNARRQLEALNSP